MMYKLAISALALTTASALPASSIIGKDLLSKARSLEQDYYSWIIDYSVQFQSCHVVNQYNFEENGGDEDNSGVQNLVKFKLCSTKKCGYGCNGAEYLVPMDQFLENYVQWNQEKIEQECENIKENCGCDDDQVDDEEACEYKCYQKYGMEEECVEQELDDQAVEFNLEENLECRELGYYGGVNYYVGPKCSANGERILLSVFSDEFCTSEAGASVYTQFSNGVSLPYSKSSIIKENCISCKQVDENADDNAYEIEQFCEESYNVAAKCETNLKSQLASPVTSDCDYINNIYLMEVGYSPVKHSVAVAFATIFGISTVILAGIAGKLYMAQSEKISLNQQGMEGTVV